MADNMDTRTWQRLSAWAGLAFVVLFVAGFIITGSSNAEYDDPRAWLSDLDDSGYRTQHLVGAYLMVASAIAFLVFSKGLLGRVAGARPVRDLPAALADAGATLFAGIVLVSGILAASVAGAIESGGTRIPDSADVPIHFDQLSVALLLIPGGFTAALFIATVSEMARRAQTFPRWLTWFGFLSAVVALFAALFFPFLIIPIWTLVSSIFLLVRGAKEGSTDAPASSISA